MENEKPLPKKNHDYLAVYVMYGIMATLIGVSIIVVLYYLLKGLR